MGLLKFSFNRFSTEKTSNEKLYPKQSFPTSQFQSNSFWNSNAFFGSTKPKEIIVESKMNFNLGENQKQDQNYYQNTTIMNRISTQNNKGFKLNAVNFLKKHFFGIVLTISMLFTLSNVQAQQCSVTFPSNTSSVPANGSTLYFTDCDKSGREVVTWTVPTASSTGNCGAISVTQTGGPGRGSSQLPGNYIVTYTAQAIDLSISTIVTQVYQFNITVYDFYDFHKFLLL